MGKTEKEIPKAWEQFFKEARIAIESGETISDFFERMQDDGFNVTYHKRDLNNERAIIIEIIQFFNSTCGTTYKQNHPSAISNQIMTRYREGYSCEIMKRVITMLAKRWKGTEMQINLRPDIIFGSLKFSAYAGLLPPINRPAPPAIAPARPQQPQSAKPQAKLTIQELAQRDAQGMQYFLEEIYVFNQSEKNVLLAIFPINIVWRFFERIKKEEISNPDLINKANQFASQKIEGYKAKMPDLEEKENKETCRRYYIIKSLLKGHNLDTVKSWARPDHFVNNHS